MKSSSKAFPRATHSPFSLKMNDWPSKISSSWPPTVLTKARHTRSSAARVASIFSRKRPLPAWYGDALMLRTSSAPPRACSVVGPVGYQMSSQMFAAMTVSPSVKTGASVPDWKYRFSSKTP